MDDLYSSPRVWRRKGVICANEGRLVILTTETDGVNVMYVIVRTLSTNGEGLLFW